MPTHPQPSDDDLVAQAKAAQEGDTRAFDQLVLRHQRGVMANCRHLTRAPSDADDLAQEVFVKAYFALPRFEGRSSFKTWINRIKINHCLNHLKKKENQIFVDMEDEALSRTPAMRVEAEAEVQDEARAQRQQIRQALDAMTDTLRVPLVLRDFDKMPYQEIAEQLGVSLSAVKMRIKRARETFRELYMLSTKQEGTP